MPVGLLELALQIALAIHAVRTGRTQPWLWIILLIPGIGCALYVVLELGPELLRGRAGQRLHSGVLQAVNPGRDYRSLVRAVAVAPTVQNQIRLAEECLRLGRAEEAVGLYEDCAVGLHATDPAVRLGLARARYAAGNPAGAVQALEALAADSPDHRTADGHLLYAEALEAAGRVDDALREYAALVDYYPGEAARCRYAHLLAQTGAADLAGQHYREVVRRVDLQRGSYQRAQREWYDMARRALAQPGPA